MTYHVVVGVDGSAHGDAALRFALAEVLGAVGLRCAAGAACPVTLIKLPSEHPEVPKGKPQIP